MPTIQEIEKRIREAIGNRPHLFRTDPLLKTIDHLSTGTRANKDSAGLGPDERYLVGRETVYTPESYIRWVLTRITSDSKKVRRAG